MPAVPTNVNLAYSALDAHPDATKYPQKGDVLVYNAVTNVWVNVGVGTDAQRLTADSATVGTGIKYAA